eukprot:UC4_evm1s546
MPRNVLTSAQLAKSRLSLSLDSESESASNLPRLTGRADELNFISSFLRDLISS